MARQVIDLRTSAQREGITRNQQTMQAITDILKTVGAAEQKRRERQTLDRIVRVIGEGKTTAEAIAAVAGEGPEFGGGIPGILQRIGGLFQPSPDGIKQSIQQTIIGDALKRALSPQPQIPPGLEPSGVTIGPTGGVTQRFEKAAKTMSPSQQITQFRLQNIHELRAKVETGTATAEDRAELKRLIGPTPLVQIGQKLLPEEDRRARAAKEHAEAMALSTSMVNSARQSVKSIIKDAPTPGWTKAWGAGQYDYSRNALIELYKHYQIETQYSSKVAADRKVLDNLWDNQIKVYNKVGHKNVRGTDEFDWDPKDPRVQQLRKEQLEAAPKTLTEAEVRALLEEVGGDVEKARQLAKQRGWIIPK